MEPTRRGFLSLFGAALVAPTLKPLEVVYEATQTSYDITTTYLIRSRIWTEQIKKILIEELMNMKFTAIIDELE